MNIQPFQLAGCPLNIQGVRHHHSLHVPVDRVKKVPDARRFQARGAKTADAVCVKQLSSAKMERKYKPVAKVEVPYHIHIQLYRITCLDFLKSITNDLWWLEVRKSYWLK